MELSYSGNLFSQVRLHIQLPESTSTIGIKEQIISLFFSRDPFKKLLWNSYVHSSGPILTWQTYSRSMFCSMWLPWPGWKSLWVTWSIHRCCCSFAWKVFDGHMEPYEAKPSASHVLFPNKIVYLIYLTLLQSLS